MVIFLWVHALDVGNPPSFVDGIFRSSSLVFLERADCLFVQPLVILLYVFQWVFGGRWFVKKGDVLVSQHFQILLDNMVIVLCNSLLQLRPDVHQAKLKANIKKVQPK